MPPARFTITITITITMVERYIPMIWYPQST